MQSPRHPVLSLWVLCLVFIGGNHGDALKARGRLGASLLVSQRVARIEQFLRGPKAEWTLRIAEGIDATLALASLQTTIELREVFAGVELPPEPMRGQSRPA